MSNQNRIAIDEELLGQISGGAIGFNPDDNGTFTMKCQFSGLTFSGVTLQQIIEIAKFAASIPNTAEGEQQIIAFAQEKKYI